MMWDYDALEHRAQLARERAWRQFLALGGNAALHWHSWQRFRRYRDLPKRLYIRARRARGVVPS